MNRKEAEEIMRQRHSPGSFQWKVDKAAGYLEGSAQLDEVIKDRDTLGIELSVKEGALMEVREKLDAAIDLLMEAHEGNSYGNDHKDKVEQFLREQGRK
jgi:hypothetical protein